MKRYPPHTDEIAISAKRRIIILRCPKVRDTGLSL